MGKPFPEGNTLGKRFEPGRSGNPGGRPKVKGRDLARYILEQTKDGQELADILLDIARDERVKRETRIKAVCELYDRGLGKSPQTVDVSVRDERPADVDFESLPLEERRKLLEALDVLDLIADSSSTGEPDAPVEH
jgi:hypothetical protein